MSLPSEHDHDAALALPTSRYPTGWFQVGLVRRDRSRDGQVAALLRRGPRPVAGRVGRASTAMDAYCLHLGVNIGVRGTVDGGGRQVPLARLAVGRRGPQHRSSRSTAHRLQAEPAAEAVSRRRLVRRGHACGTTGSAGSRCGTRRTSSRPGGGRNVLPDSARHAGSSTGSRRTRRCRWRTAADIFHVVYVHGGEPAELISLEFDGTVPRSSSSASTYGGGRSRPG